MIDLRRSSYYYRSTARALNPGDTELVAIIEDIQDELPGYGYRPVTHELLRRGHLVNHKRVARVMRGQRPGNQASQAVCPHDGLQPRFTCLPEPLSQCDPVAA
ncbi:IS3 family transposase [Rhizobium glycinendophyticum]|uniref:Transposase n=1 Tax=Rhizobium glycinendophyticum TaxID=2589807 RepID=A0A504U1D2_9HYPH|nr:transposase [Rhizobium glycinendophyticum]